MRNSFLGFILCVLYVSTWSSGSVGGFVRLYWKLNSTFVTEQPAPALLAVALPGLLAGPVDAAGVPGTLIAAVALPALVARTLAGRLAETVLFAAPLRTDG